MNIEDDLSIIIRIAYRFEHTRDLLVCHTCCV